MTDLADYWPPPDAPDPVPTPRKCLHPKPARRFLEDGGMACTRCGKDLDPAASRRGRSSRRLGHDGERRSEKRYGWRKVGEAGGPDDLVGTLAIVQQKTTRGAPPRRWQQILDRLEGMAAGRTPLLLLSYVRHGVGTEDYIVMTGEAWLALHGRDDPA